MPSVFITRQIDPEGPLHSMLTAKGWTVRGFSLVDFLEEPVEKLPKSDWLFFYSKNGVRFLLRQVPAAKLKAYRLAAIGPGTSAALERYGLPVHFTGTGEPASTARAFEKTAAGYSVAFVQAKHSKRSVERLLSGKITSSTLIVYNNVPKGKADVPPSDLYIFTSPLNVSAFASLYAPLQPSKVLAIGPSTAAAIQELWKFSPEISPAPDEESMAKRALSMYP